MLKGEIVFEGALDKGFAREILQEPGGENLLKCIQCGTCSAACPVSFFMDYTPRQIIAMTREGFKNEVLASQTIWLCASCYNCTVNCPAGVKITEIMYILKRKAIESGVKPKKYPEIPTRLLSISFYRHVKENGRINEGKVVMDYKLRSQIKDLIKMAPLGFSLMKKGRMNILKKEKIKDINGLKNILNSVEE